MTSTPPPVAAPRTRLAYILLALFLGTLGIHNFYSGHTKHGVI
jgi:TM2 domain-containing membrane protein YozV